ncbi:helicase domain protein [Nitzschia inconspicua]|uniref:Helicase domain protein n=1 Tax=Nitzschia inconspicua TaxID=303405 RepID=A0A9K3LGP5_9STRA|nr:helicase domain protein [Nitzschia inconspicua]
MAPLPPAGIHRPEHDPAAPADSEKKAGGDPLSFLASITERVLGTNKKEPSVVRATAAAAAEPTRAPNNTLKKEQGPAAVAEKPKASKPKPTPSATANSNKAKKNKGTDKAKKPSAQKKRKREKEEEDEDRKVSHRSLQEERDRPPVSQVVINKADNGMDDSHSVLQPPETVASYPLDDYREQYLAAQAALAGQWSQQQGQAAATTATIQSQLRQQLLMEERMMMMMRMENTSMNQTPENFFRRQYAAFEQEELELAALRRRREQLLLNMNSREELLLRNSMAGNNLAHQATFGLAAGLNNNSSNNVDYSAFTGGPSPPGASAFSTLDNPLGAVPFGQHAFNGTGNMTSTAAATASMVYPHSILTSSSMSNSPLLRALSAHNALSTFQQASMLPGASDPLPGSLAASTDPAMTVSAAAMGAACATADPTSSGDVAAKRLAPARGVFNKNIKSNDDVIDSLARARARFYKNDTKKSGQQRFRGYQCEQWTQKFQDLLEFKAENGNCQVPHCYKKNIGLARWVKRQRYQYKLMIDGKQSTMTEERVKLLQDVGFVWDSHSSTWEERLNELREYARIHGDCNVPSSYAENPKLATWIKCQRRQYKLLQEGRTSNMTLERMTELQRVGFCWRVQDERR